MITEATLRRAHLYPELIPDTWFGTIPAAAEFAPPILDIRRIAPLFIFLQDIAISRDDTVELRIRADKLRAAAINAGSLRGDYATVLGGIDSNKFSIFAKDNLYYNLYSLPGAA
ncbi:unnamed protein product, partial [marine sediment metagenome]